MVRVVLVCRDHVDNMLFEAEVCTIEDERIVWKKCREYADDVWLDYYLKDCKESESDG